MMEHTSRPTAVSIARLQCVTRTSQLPNSVLTGSLPVEETSNVDCKVQLLTDHLERTSLSSTLGLLAAKDASKIKKMILQG
jgi:hypothetical protein